MNPTGPPFLIKEKPRTSRSEKPGYHKSAEEAYPLPLPKGKGAARARKNVFLVMVSMTFEPSRITGRFFDSLQ